MVNPIYIFVIALGIAFLLTLFDKISRTVSLLIFFAALLAMTIIPAFWFSAFLNGAKTLTIYTAGFKPPFSINLQFGLIESFFVLMSNLVGLLAAFYLLKKLKETSAYAMMLLLTLIMGINGLIMTRDMFNLFVFMEITSISTYALIAMEHNIKSLSAGFKYLIAGSIASSLYLIGTIYLYHLTGTLNIDGMIESKNLIVGSLGFISVFLLIFAIIIELKPFPANGWALDVYQSTDSGVVSIIAVANSGAMFFVLYKLLPLLPISFVQFIAGLGLVTFFFSNLMGLKQKNARRLLGYSSIAQMGLLISVLALLLQNGSDNNLLSFVLIVGGLFVNHFFAKAGLFWLAGIIKKDKIKDWAVISQNPLLILLFGTFVFSLVGLPPFPGFWAKWELIMQLAAHKLGFWMWAILLGSLLELVYYLRWFGYALKGKTKEIVFGNFNKTIPIILFFFALFYSGLFISNIIKGFTIFYYLPILVATVLFALDWLNVKIKGIISLLIVAAFSYYLIPDLSGINRLFSYIFIIAGFILIIGTMNAKGTRQGFYPFLLLMLLSLGNLLQAETTLQFFFSWELMAVSSYFLIIRGKNAEKPALTYILFSSAGAYLILIGFAYGFAETGSLYIYSLAGILHSAPLIFILLSIGFLTKSGALGLHVWLPGAYAEADDDVTPFISSILSKAGIFGLILFLTVFGKQYLLKISLPYLLGWLGILTALFGALMAVFQEDIKKLLAYSSMSQIGYIIMSVGLMSHLGWVSAIYLSFNHLFFKALLFLAIAGIISRVNTRNMYEMGGLIKKMPLSFVSVLIAIIALAGIPPLSGFGSKWMMYTALIEKGWYYIAGFAFFSSAMAFLYLYKLIHTIFLGQVKQKHRDVKEASLWFIIPQYIFIFAIMAISVFPNIIIKPISDAVNSFFASTIQWQGNTLLSSLGYWNGNIVMKIVMVIFMIYLIWLLFRVKSVQKVKQFNIVYAAERPEKPETTHYAYNFYAHYQKALGFLVRPVITKFWNSVAEWFHSTAAVFRNIYTGNGQTYALHIIILLVLSYFIIGK